MKVVAAINAVIVVLHAALLGRACATGRPGCAIVSIVCCLIGAVAVGELLGRSAGQARP